MAGSDSLVLDASFLVALANSRDAHHQAAARLASRVLRRGRPLLLPEYVFAETVTVIGTRAGMEEARRWGSALMAARDVTIVPAFDRLRPTWALFSGQPKARLSLADAAVVVTALSAGTRAVATFDTAFDDIDAIEVLGR